MEFSWRSNFSPLTIITTEMCQAIENILNNVTEYQVLDLATWALVKFDMRAYSRGRVYLKSLFCMGTYSKRYIVMHGVIYQTK